MKKLTLVFAALALAGLCGCSSLNIGLGGTLGDVNLGADIDPLNKSIRPHASASKTLSGNGVDTTINTSTDGSGVDVGAHVDKK